MPEASSNLARAYLSIPEGKIPDFIDGTFRNETPEEYVRQEIEKSLVREYLYPRKEMGVEFPIKFGASRKRVDVAIFAEGSLHKQEDILAIIECKAESVPPVHRTEGVEQLKSYLAACGNAEYGLWTNGKERFCFHVVRDPKFEPQEVIDIPVKGKTLADVEQPTIKTLDPANSDDLLFAFRGCHNYIAGNQGLQKPEAFWELLKLIFCKIADERAIDLKFYATSVERSSLNGQLKVKKRIDPIFAEVTKKYRAIFRENDAIELNPRVLAYVVSRLQKYSLLKSAVDVKGKAYEEIVGSNLRGDRGEFFTPRNVCKMAVEMLDPGPGQVVVDPACGTGGFLTIAMNHVISKIERKEQKTWDDSDNPSPAESRELYRAIQEYANDNVVGIDLNPNLVKATKMNMVMNNDGSGGVYQGNSLDRPVTWREELRDRELQGNADLLFTNPPFGTHITIDDPSVLEQYDLGHTWEYDEAADIWRKRDPLTLLKAQPPEILFIERAVQFVKPKTGIVAIVLPDGILGNPDLGYVREWILQQTRVLASIDLHPDTFQPHNGTSTSLLILQRKTPELIEHETASGKKLDYAVFMALVNHVGHDKRGTTAYKRNADGDEVLEYRDERVRVSENGKTRVVTSTVKAKAVDDETPQIATAFRKWWATER